MKIGRRVLATSDKGIKRRTKREIDARNGVENFRLRNLAKIEKDEAM